MGAAMARGKISFATFNLKNLQLPNAPVYESPRFYSDAEYEEKRAWIAARLNEIDADVIGFQEVFSAAALEDCFRHAGLEGEYELAARDAPTPGRVQVALAARRGMLQPGFYWHEAFPARFRLLKRPPESGNEPDESVDVGIEAFSRPVLDATVAPKSRGAPPIRVLVAHLKSKRPIMLDAPEKRRLNASEERTLGEALALVRRGAEAAALRVLLHEEMYENDVPFVVMGDLNDDYLSVTTTILTNDPSYKLFVASTVGARPSKGADIGLYSTQMLQEYRSLRDVSYTHIYRNKMEVLDHILVSEQFYDHSMKRVWGFRSLEIWNDHLPDAEESRIVGDHGIVKASFDHLPMEDASGAVRSTAAAGEEAPPADPSLA
jgi:endonuclease/exonuclease/phosphatase family metal-dependent hydrolase